MIGPGEPVSGRSGERRSRGRLASGRTARARARALVLATLCSASAVAADGALVGRAETPRVSATLAPELAAAAPGTSVAVVLHQRIIDGWHTYWENPGDSGERIDIAWTLPEGVTAGPLRYPTPEPIRVGPLMNHGYSGEAAVLAELSIPSDWPAGRPVPLAAHATWLVCEAECVPEEARFEITLPTAAAPAPLDAVAPLFADARAAMPRPAPWPVSVARADPGLLLTVDAPPGAVDLEGAWFFASAWGHLAHAAAQPLRVVDGRQALVLTEGELPAGESLEGLLRIAGEPPAGYTVAASIGVAPAGAEAAAQARAGALSAPAGPVPATPAPATAVLLVLAFAGGVLLNVMPCVFPVLAMKSMALVRHAAEPRAARLTGGLAYTGGVLASFAALAGLLLVLKSGGESLGWGFHLQSPTVVAALALVLFAVGLSLSGVLQVGGAWTGAGSELARRPGHLGSFFTGVLATVVAAPCTAPFMATAIGVALLQSAPVALAVFLALGLGLAAPYLLLTAVPALSVRMPRPGPWMERARQLLAFPMYASAAWLVWVLAQQAGADAVGLALLAMVALALAAWCFGAASAASSAGSRIGRALGGAAAAGALVALVAVGAQAPPADEAGEERARAPDELAERYDPVRIEAVLADGGAVFLNVTAAWCVTCKVNERIALSGEAFRNSLVEAGVTYMKGDWTRRDPAITALLERFGRAGVPLYVIYPRGGGAPRVLPQLLTGSVVRAALAGA